MNREEIETSVRDVLAQVMDVDPKDIGPEFGQASCDNWGSLTHLMLITELESRFSVAFSSQEVPQLSSYSRIVEALASRAKNR
jgi:acyl carrier protein